jgi:hypothetical protein
MHMSVVALVQVNTQIANDDAPNFDDFCLLYPKRVARKDAERAWNRLTATDKADALTALVVWRREWIKRGEMQYVPNGATWLNGERWTDELPAPVHTVAHASHVAVSSAGASDASATSRGAIPDHVRAVIEKLRAK